MTVRVERVTIKELEDQLVDIFYRADALELTEEQMADRDYWGCHHEQPLCEGYKNVMFLLGY